LYADSANLDSEAINLEALETLVHVAGMAVELLAVRSAPPRHSTATAPQAEETPAAAREPEPPAYTPIAEYDEVTPVVEESAPAAEFHDVSEAAPEQFEVMPEPETFEITPEPEQFEIAPESQQTFTAPEPGHEPFEAAPTHVEAPPETSTPSAELESTASSTPRRRYGIEVELPVEVNTEEERRLHNDARRFARLLVSEIKLYNEQKVTEGRSQNDLYVRLRDYIDRSREMYDKRVKPEVANRYDYFHQELVNTLADGDASKMGTAYPGATVAV
jgi:hypothetical protein